MKYCENCKETKKSWGEVRGASSCSNAFERCWSCDKYTLTPSSLSLVRASGFGGSSTMQNLINRFVSDPSPNASIKHQIKVGDMKNGDYCCEIVEADKGKGYYYYQYTEYKRGG